MARHNKLGALGEQLARDLLISKGLTVRETNWRLNHLEIDVVAHDPARNVLHVVEVKTRSDDSQYDPMLAITPAKMRNMVAAANGYVNYYKLNCPIQMDVIFIVGEEPNFRIEYLPDAFEPRLKTY